MSPFLHYMFGFCSAVILVSVILIVVYQYLKRRRLKQSEIIGYLDLIPDLTRQQIEQAQAIRNVFLPKVAGIRKRLRIQRSRLADALFMEPSDNLEIQSISEKIIRLQTELEHEVVEHILEEKELLSPSQKRNFHDIIIDQFSAGGLGIHDVKGKQSEKGARPTGK